MSNTVTHKFVEDGFVYLNKRNLEAFFGLYADDMRNPSLATMGLPTTKDGFKAFVNGFYASFSEPRFLPQKILCEGDSAMFHWVFKGTHTGDFNGVKPTGRPVEVNAFTTFRMGASGKIVEQHDVADMLSLLKQIGAMG